MKLRLKYFGIGLFIAGLLFTITERYDIPYVSKYIETSDNDDTVKQYKKEIKDLKAQLKKIETVDASSDKETTEQASNEENTVVEEENSSAEAANSDVIKGTVYIYESLSLYELGQQVEDLGIISNGRELELYLSKPDYARKVQKGQFDLSSDMTIEQMAKILTGQKID